MCLDGRLLIISTLLTPPLSHQILPAFSYFIKSQFDVSNAMSVLKTDAKRRQDNSINGKLTHGLNIAFSVRKVGDLTGRREIANMPEVRHHPSIVYILYCYYQFHDVFSLSWQVYLAMQRAMRLSNFVYNISFEDLDVQAVVRRMASLHVFVSVHGAGLTNTFFMQPGAVVVEILPYPLCQCRSPDYFYGIAG